MGSLKGKIEKDAEELKRELGEERDTEMRENEEKAETEAELLLSDKDDLQTEIGLFADELIENKMAYDGIWKIVKDYYEEIKKDSEKDYYEWFQETKFPCD